MTDEDARAFISQTEKGILAAFHAHVAKVQEAVEIGPSSHCCRLIPFGLGFDVAGGRVVNGGARDSSGKFKGQDFSNGRA